MTCFLTYLKRHAHLFWSSTFLSAFIFLVILRLYDFTGGYQFSDASVYNTWAARGYYNPWSGSFYNSWVIADDATPWLQIYITRGIFSVLGVSELSSRLYVGVCGCLLLIVVYLLGRRISNRYGGWLSMLIVGLSPQTIHFSRINGLDVPLALWLTLATYCALDAPESTRRSGLCGVFCGLAFFTKYTGLVSLVLAGYPILRRRWRNALIGFLTFGLVTSPIWYQLAALKWHPFISHSGQAFLDTWPIARLAVVGLFGDIGLFLPLGVGAFLMVALARRLDRRVFVPSLLLVTIFALFLIIRRWWWWYVVELLPSFAVIAAYSLAKVYELSHKILRVWIVVGIIGILVINSLAATSFVAAFTANNSWKIVGGVAQGFAETYGGCPIVFVPQEWEALWYFRDYNWHNYYWVLQVHPNRFIMVATTVYLSEIKDYLHANSGLTFHELVLWHSSTFVRPLHPPTYNGELMVLLITVDAPPYLYPPLTRTC